MAEPAKIDLNRIKRGDTYIVDFFFVDTDGTKDITAVNITAQARRELDGAVWFDLNPVKIDAENGHFRIHLTAFQTRAITESPPGSFSGIYDIQFAWSGATEVYVSTIIAGSISISKDVTYPEVNGPVGGSSMTPSPDQSVAIYFSLNPGTPNYSDVVTAEELTPAQYQIAASLGLANVNAINEAAESARLAKVYRDESEDFSQSASQSASLATIQAATATQKAAEAKVSEQNAAAIVTGGTATIDPSPGKIPLANAEGKISSGWLTALAFARTKADMDAMRASVNRQCAASGMIHAGIGYTNGNINEGMWSLAGGHTRLFLGKSGVTTGQLGSSETDYPVFNIAGFPVSLRAVNNPSQNQCQLKFPQAPDGTDIYDSSGNCRGTGKPTLNLLTEVDPKYGDVAPNVNEAVARAFEGVVKNGDFRLGDNGDWAPLVPNRGAYSINSGELTVTDTTNKNPALGSMSVAPVGLSSTAGVTYTVEVYVSSLTSSGVDSHAFRLGGYQDPNQTFVELKLGLNTFIFTAGISITDAFLIYTGNNQSITVSSVSIRPITEEVVTERVDLSGLEGYLEEITPAKPYIYPYGGINNQATSVDGIATTVDNVRPITYFANFDGDTTSRGLGWNLNDLTDAQLLTILQNPYHHVYVIDGRLVQFRVRPRTIKGAGNGDWETIDSNRTGANFTLAFSAKAFIQAQAGLDSSTSHTIGWTNNTYFVEGATTSNIIKHGDRAVFRPRTTMSGAYNGECYFYVLATVLRLNQGAYHPSFNPLGALCWRDGNGTALSTSKAWQAVTEPECKNFSKTKAFKVLPTGGPQQTAASSTSGYIGSPAGSGRPDGILYDAIYPDGQGGVIDRRLSAFPFTMEDYFKAMAKAENGTMRGMEKLVLTRIEQSSPVASSIENGLRVVRYAGNLFNLTPNVPTQAINSSIYITTGGQYTVISVRYASSVDQTYVTTNQAEVVEAGEHYIVFGSETNLSVSGNFLQTDVIGDPASILQVDALKKGWMGSWIPIIPDGTNPWNEFIATRSRRGSGDLVKLQTDNYGQSWTLASHAWNAVTNSPTATSMPLSSRVEIWHYTAAAKVTKPSSVLPVYGEETGISSVRALSNYWPTDGVFLAESLMGKLLTNNSGVRSMRLPLIAFSLPATGKFSTASAYHPLIHGPINLSAPVNNSPAIKILPHAVSNNGQATLGFAWNELKHNGEDWGDDGTMRIIDNTGTYNNLNGESCLYGYAELALPVGWVDNHARFGAQVPGVDL